MGPTILVLTDGLKMVILSHKAAITVVLELAMLLEEKSWKQLIEHSYIPDFKSLELMGR